MAANTKITVTFTKDDNSTTSYDVGLNSDGHLNRIINAYQVQYGAFDANNVFVQATNSQAKKAMVNALVTGWKNFTKNYELQVAQDAAANTVVDIPLTPGP